MHENTCQQYEWNKPKSGIPNFFRFGDPGLTYAFSGTQVSATLWIPVLQELRTLVEERSGRKFNFVLVNRYADGKDNIGKAIT